MRTVAEERFRRVTERMLHQSRLRSHRGVVAVARRMDPMVDLQRLWVRGWTELRIQGAGHGASSGDVGKFWFLAGYSKTGGPDVEYEV